MEKYKEYVTMFGNEEKTEDFRNQREYEHKEYGCIYKITESR